MPEWTKGGRMMWKVLVLCSILLLVVGSLGCLVTVPGELMEYREEIPLAGVTAARVEVDLGVGNLSLTAGEPNVFFSGRFRTNVAAWKPEVTWQHGTLRITQPSTRGIFIGSGAKNEWDLYLAPEVPLDLKLDIGVSKGYLDLTRLAVTNFSMDTGTSSVVVRWTAPPPVPMKRFLLCAGTGDIEVQGLGYASPREVRVEGGVGDITLDFTGPWTTPAQVKVTAGVGTLTLRFPKNLGVRVVGLEDRFTVDIRTKGDWRFCNGVFVNQPCDQAGTALEVTIKTGVGSVILESE